MKKEEEKKRKRSKGIIIWILLFIVFVGLGFAAKSYLPSLMGEERTISAKQLEAEIKEISELASLKYTYRETIEKVGKGIFSNTYIATFDGTIKAGINLKETEIEVNKSDSKSKPTVNVYVPNAKILSHEDSKAETIYESGYKTSGVGKARNKAIKKKKAEREKQFIKKGNLKKAEDKSKEVISDFIHSLYGEDIQVDFTEKEPQSGGDEE